MLFVAVVSVVIFLGAALENSVTQLQARWIDSWMDRRMDRIHQKGACSGAHTNSFVISRHQQQKHAIEACAYKN